MDPVTQGLLGASLAGSLSKKKQTRAAIFAGTIGGLFPDFDILIKSNIDPLLAIEYHRNFSHSLVFIPFGGLIVTFFLFLFLRTRLSFRYIYFLNTWNFNPWFFRCLYKLWNLTFLAIFKH